MADRAAALADEVMVHRRGGDLVVGGDAREPRLLDELETDQQLERAVDRGHVDFGQRLLHLGGDLLGGAMAAAAAHRLPDGHALWRQPIAGLADRLASMVHGATLSQPQRSCKSYIVASAQERADLRD